MIIKNYNLLGEYPPIKHDLFTIHQLIHAHDKKAITSLISLKTHIEVSHPQAHPAQRLTRFGRQKAASVVPAPPRAGDHI